MTLEEYVKRRQCLVLEREHSIEESMREALTHLINDLDTQWLIEHTVDQETLNQN